MSTTSVKNVVKSLITDSSFRESFIKNPSQTISTLGIELTDLELKSLKNLKLEDLEFLITENRDSEDVIIDVAVKTWSGAGPGTGTGGGGN